MNTYLVFFIDNEGKPHEMQLSENETERVHEEMYVISCIKAGEIA